MTQFFEVLAFSLLAGILSISVGIILISKQSLAKKLAVYATPFAAGALLAAVFLDLLPEGIEASGDAEKVLFWTLIGIAFFFMLERFLTWFHHHHSQDEHENKSKASLIVVGNSLHNALDGVAIATAFLISVPVGIVTTIAVILHEVPHGIGDFGLLLSHKFSRKKVLLMNLVIAISIPIAASIAYFLGSNNAIPLGPLLGISAGFLLYISLSDIIPSIHENTPKHKLLDIRPILLIVGVVVVGCIIFLARGLEH